MNIAIWKRLLCNPYGLGIGLCILLQGLVIAISSPLLPVVLSDKIGMDKLMITAFFLTMTLFVAVFALISGYLSDGRVGRYKLVLAGGVLSVVGYLVIATARQPAPIFLAGIGIATLGIMFPQFFAAAKLGLLADWERGDQIKGITALRTLFSLGFIFGTAVASGLTKVIDIQAVFFVVAGSTVVLTITATLVISRVERQINLKTADTPQSDERASVSSIALPFSALIVPLLAVIILQGADSTRTYFLSLVTFQFFNDASIAPLLFGITATAELVTMSLLGNLAGRIGAKNAIAFGALVGAFYFGVQSVSQSLPVLYAAQVIYALFIAALEGVGLAYIQGLLAHRVGMGGALYMTLMNIGSVVGLLTPLLVVGYSSALFIIPAVLSVAGAVLLLVGDHTAQIEQRLKDLISPNAPVPSLSLVEGK